MAKKNKASADRVRNKKKGTVTKFNPFEVKFNRQKHDVLGRKVSKHDRGKPGLSRSKSIKKRKETLLKEYNERLKANAFVDKRIGEGDTSLTVEEKMVKRFATEVKKTHSKGDMFNLNEDEDLTHFGQSLAEIENFEEPEISDDEDEEEIRQNARIVADEHFGGFLTKADEGEDKRSWKEKMEDVIAKSKKEKYERQAEKEKNKELTDQLDEEWKTVRLLMGDSLKRDKHQENPPYVNKVEDYDIKVRELKFEAKGQPTDRLKTEEELAKEEKERLEKLEADRIRRMKGLTDEEVKPKTSSHISADDLNDGFSLEPKVKFHVSYKDGTMLTEDSDTEKRNEESNAEEESEEESDDAVADSMDDQDNEDDEDDAVGDDEDDDDDGEDDDDGASDDSYADIESDKEASSDGEDGEDEGNKKSSQRKRNLSQKKQKIMAEAKKEIPYTFDAPGNYDELLNLLHGHSEKEQLLIIERIRKCHHVSLAEGNKEKMQQLFTLLVQYFCDLAIQEPPQLKLVDKLVHHIYQLTKQSTAPAAQFILEQIIERQSEFRQICERKGGRGQYPALDTFLLLKLVSVLFPTSDFRHTVTTPCLIFMTQMLAQCAVNNERDVAAGLFICNLCLEYVSLSKRYIPEVRNFLHGLLFLSVDKEPGKFEPVVPPFKPIGKNINILKIDSSQNRDLSVRKLRLSEVLSTDLKVGDLSNNQFRLNALSCGLHLLLEFSKLYSDLASYREIMEPVERMCEKLPRHMYPASVQEQINSVLSTLSSSHIKCRKCLVMQKRKPQPIKLFEPKIEDKFEGKKKKGGNREFNEKQKLIHKHKKELKGAIREVKKDTQFLAREKLNAQLSRDAERKRKVKELHAMLSSQEGDFNALKRMKKS